MPRPTRSARPPATRATPRAAPTRSPRWSRRWPRSPRRSPTCRHPQAELAIELERRAVELGLALAGKVVGGALSVQPELVIESVTGALRGIVERERVTVLVNPDDLEIVREAMDGLRASLGGIDHCVVEAERRVGRGGCIVRTPVGDVDATRRDQARACGRGRRRRARPLMISA